MNLQFWETKKLLNSQLQDKNEQFWWKKGYALN